MTFKSKKGVYGIGKNDADYPTQVNGKHCPYYLKWKTMLLRVVKKPYNCYDEVNVCEEWLTFSNFKSWMEKQDWEGKHLDKDLLGDGKLYSPDNCCFIDPVLNSFLAENPVGKYKVGVGKNYNRYLARCCNPFTGERERLGTFGCETAAHLAYKRKKLEHAIELAKGLDPKLAKSLIGKFTGLGSGKAGAVDFDLESYTLKPVEPQKAPVVESRDDF